MHDRRGPGLTGAFVFLYDPHIMLDHDGTPVVPPAKGAADTPQAAARRWVTHQGQVMAWIVEWLVEMWAEDQRDTDPLAGETAGPKTTPSAGVAGYSPRNPDPAPTGGTPGNGPDEQLDAPKRAETADTRVEFGDDLEPKAGG